MEHPSEINLNPFLQKLKNNILKTCIAPIIFGLLFFLLSNLFESKYKINQILKINNDIFSESSNGLNLSNFNPFNMSSNSNNSSDYLYFLFNSNDFYNFAINAKKLDLDDHKDLTFKKFLDTFQIKSNEFGFMEIDTIDNDRDQALENALKIIELFNTFVRNKEREQIEKEISYLQNQTHLI